MGCVMSYDEHRPSSDNKTTTTTKVRVVHLDGRIEDYNVPIKVNQIIHNPKKEVMCTKTQLLCPTASSKAYLNSEFVLELGNLYFLIPISAFKEEASLMDMANTVNKLTIIAKSTKLNECARIVKIENGTKQRCGSLEKCVWKPVLDTIGEKSVHERSESDLLDDY